MLHRKTNMWRRISCIFSFFFPFLFFSFFCNSTTSFSLFVEKGGTKIKKKSMDESREEEENNRKKYINPKVGEARNWCQELQRGKEENSRCTVVVILFASDDGITLFTPKNPIEADNEKDLHTHSFRKQNLSLERLRDR